MTKHQPLTQQELNQVMEETKNNKVKLKGNIIFTNKVGNSKVIFTDEALPKTQEEKKKVTAGIERAIEAIYPGYKCTVTSPRMI